MTGTLLQLNVKPRVPGEFGLPKTPVPELEVSPAGAVGDYNRWRTEQGDRDPDQAILVITKELLDTLVAEGWPVKPGDLGENFTVGGISEAALEPGVRLRSGAVLIEETKACDPCDVLYTLPYIGKERGPEFLRTTVGRRGWYAKVLQGGTVTPGSAISLER